MWFLFFVFLYLFTHLLWPGTRMPLYMNIYWEGSMLSCISLMSVQCAYRYFLNSALPTIWYWIPISASTICVALILVACITWARAPYFSSWTTHCRAIFHEWNGSMNLICVLQIISSFFYIVMTWFIDLSYCTSEATLVKTFSKFGQIVEGMSMFS